MEFYMKSIITSLRYIWYGLLSLLLLLYAHAVYAEESGHSPDHSSGFRHALFLEKPTPCQMVMVNYIGASGVEEEGKEVNTHTAELVAAYPVNRYIGFEAAVPWTYTDADDPDNDKNRFGHVHAAIHGAVYINGHWVAGLFLGLGVPVDSRNEGEEDTYHIEPGMALGFTMHPVQIVVNAGVGIPLDSDSDEKELKYGLYIILGSFFDIIDIIGEFSGETVSGGDNDRDTSLFMASGFRIYPFGYESFNLGCGVEFPVYNGERDMRLLVSLAYHF